MIKPGNAEIPGVVAFTALQGSGNMRGSLSAGKYAIVTLPAARGRPTVYLVKVAIGAVDGAVGSLQGEAPNVVVELRSPGSAQGYFETPCIVAGAAILTGSDMFRGTLCPLAVVTTPALGGGVFEIIFRVAGFALQCGVCTHRGQLGGLVVIAFRLGCGGRHSQSPRHEESHRQYQMI